VRTADDRKLIAYDVAASGSRPPRTQRG